MLVMIDSYVDKNLYEIFKHFIRPLAKKSVLSNPTCAT